jgi:hypothetical protein
MFNHLQYKSGILRVRDILEYGRSYFIWCNRPMSDAHFKHTTKETPDAYCSVKPVKFVLLELSVQIVFTYKYEIHTFCVSFIVLSSIVYRPFFEISTLKHKHKIPERIRVQNKRCISHSSLISYPTFMFITITDNLFFARVLVHINDFLAFNDIWR